MSVCSIDTLHDHWMKAVLQEHIAFLLRFTAGCRAVFVLHLYSSKLHVTRDTLVSLSLQRVHPSIHHLSPLSSAGFRTGCQLITGLTLQCSGRIIVNNWNHKVVLHVTQLHTQAIETWQISLAILHACRDQGCIRKFKTRGILFDRTLLLLVWFPEREKKMSELWMLRSVYVSFALILFIFVCLVHY